MSLTALIYKLIMSKRELTPEEQEKIMKVVIQMEQALSGLMGPQDALRLGCLKLSSPEGITFDDVVALKRIREKYLTKKGGLRRKYQNMLPFIEGPIQPFIKEKKVKNIITPEKIKLYLKTTLN